MNKKTITAIVAVSVLLVIIGVAYAALATTLEIKGTTTVKKQTWEVKFTDVKATPPTSNKIGAKTVALSNIATNATTITWSTTLNEPGDYAEFVAKIENTGTIDAVIASSTFSLGLATASASNVISYDVCYVDDIDGTNFVTANGDESDTCVHPSVDNVFYGSVSKAADNTKITSRYVKVKLYFDPDAVDKTGSNLQTHPGTLDSENSDETQNTFTIITSIPFVQYTGA